jgi:hypothetical protein
MLFCNPVELKSVVCFFKLSLWIGQSSGAPFKLDEEPERSLDEQEETSKVRCMGSDQK